MHPTRDFVDFEREPNRVHLTARFIMNGVCVKWVGWVDMETLNGKAKLLFDEEQAKVRRYWVVMILQGEGGRGRERERERRDG
jgi:hypothetical protein